MLKRITAFFLATLMMILTYGAVFSADETTESDVVRFGVFSDSHSYMSYIEDVFDDFYELSENGTALDGVVMNGDILYVAEGVTPSEEHYAPLLALEKYQELNSQNKIVYTMGNHEFPQYSNDDKEVGKVAREAFKQYTGFDPERHVVLSGYHFISAGPEAYSGNLQPYEEFIKTAIEEALAESEDKPVFLSVHYPMPDSVYGSPSSTNTRISAEFREYINNQPRLVVLTGHTHHPQADPRSIRQHIGGCTYVSTSQLMSDSGTVTDSYSTTGRHSKRVSEAMMMEINPDTNVVTFKRFHADGENPDYLDNEDWVIDIPAMVQAKETSDASDDLAAYKYTFEERRKESVAPYFPEGSNATLSGLSATGVNVTVPQALNSALGENNMAKFYEFKVINVSEAITLKEDIIISDYFLRPTNRRSMYTHFISGLTSGTDYKIEVYATNPWYKKSKPLTVEFTTPEEEKFETVTFDAENTIEVKSENIANDNGSVQHRGSYIQVSEKSAGMGFTATFEIEKSGMYRFMASQIGSTGTNTKAVICKIEDNGEKTILKTSERYVSTGGATTWVYNYPYADLPLTKGTYTMTWSVDATSATSTLDNVKAARFAPLPEEYLDEYAIEKTASEYSDTSETVEEGQTPESFTLNTDGYVTWSVTPDYTGIYKLSYDSLKDAKTTVTSQNVTQSGETLEALPENEVISAGSELEMKLFTNVTYDFKFIASEDNTTVSGMSLIWQEGFTDLENEAYRFTYSCPSGEVSYTDLAYQSLNAGPSTTDNPKYYEKNILIPMDANYTVSLNAGLATDGKINMFIETVKGGTVSVLSTGDTATIENRIVFTDVPLKGGETYKITIFNATSGKTLRLSDIVLETSGLYNADIDDFTFLASDYTKSTYFASSICKKRYHAIIHNNNVTYTLKPGAGTYKVIATCRYLEGAPELNMYVNNTLAGTYSGGFSTDVKSYEMGTIRVSDDEFTLKIAMPKYDVRKRVYLYSLRLVAIDEPEVAIYSGESADRENIITSIDTTLEAITAKAFLPKEANGKTITMVLAVYKNNSLYKIGMYEATGTKNTVTAVTIDELGLEEGEKYSTKVLFVNGLNSLMPLYSPPVAGMLQSPLAE